MNIVEKLTNTSWSTLFTFQREIAVIKCGWKTKNNSMTRTGLKIANTEWDNLSPAAQKILINHGYSK